MSSTSKQYILITGASRGIGLEFVKQYASYPNTIVLAAVRNPSTSDLLQDISKQHSNIHTLTLDVSSESSIRAFPKQVEQYTKYVNVLINNAASLEPIENSEASKIDFAVLQQLYFTNTFAPVLITQTLLPYLQSIPKDTKVPARVIMISSIVASISSNRFGTNSAYSSSKTALNQLTKSFVRENLGVTFLLIHPGWVATKMGKVFGEPPLTPEESVKAMRKIIDDATLERSGEFVDYEGKTIPW